MWRSAIRRSCSQRFCPGSTASDRLGRSKLAMNIRGSRSPSSLPMSWRTALSAVAVRAITGTSGNCSFSRCSCPYSGRKWCPQLLTQCASSMAISDSGRCGSVWKNEGPSTVSGETYSSFRLPSASCRFTARSSSGERLLFRYAAAMPLACNACTWSFISAIRGEITSVRPSSANAGTW